jgi:shikimate dehydrogenase
VIEMNISGKTKICAIIGDPIDHTMSPPMHNAAYKELGLDYIYLPFKVQKEHLKQAVEGLKALNVRGFNVTMPHKVSIIPMLDGLDPLAEKIGAVNTVVNDNGVLTGHNTDGLGVLKALLEKGIEPEGKKVVVIGAGGASRAISYVLAQRGARLTILNRKLELDWADKIAASIKQDLGAAVKVMELGFKQLQSALAGADILINATSVGMSPDVSSSLVPAELLKSSLTVFDVIYSPLKTKLLREAEAAGCRIIGGVDMLVWQGILCFEKWTGQPAPLETMRREAIRLLERHED